MSICVASVCVPAAIMDEGWRLDNLGLQIRMVAKRRRGKGAEKFREVKWCGSDWTISMVWMEKEEGMLSADISDDFL